MGRNNAQIGGVQAQCATKPFKLDRGAEQINVSLRQDNANVPENTHVTYTRERMTTNPRGYRTHLPEKRLKTNN